MENDAVLRLKLNSLCLECEGGVESAAAVLEWNTLTKELWLCHFELVPDQLMSHTHDAFLFCLIFFFKYGVMWQKGRTDFDYDACHIWFNISYCFFRPGN